MARRTKTESAHTRAAILDAAETEMEIRGVAHTSFERIARRAHVTRGAIYWHFADKGDLLSAMLARTHLPLRDLRQGLGEHLPGHDPVWLLREMLLHGLERLATDAQHRRVCHIMMHCCEITDQGHPAAGVMRALFEDARSVLVSLCQEAADAGHMSSAIDSQNAADMIMSFMSGVYDCTLRYPDLYQANRDWRPLVDTLLAGLFVDAPAGGSGRALAS